MEEKNPSKMEGDSTGKSEPKTRVAEELEDGDGAEDGREEEKFDQRICNIDREFNWDLETRSVSFVSGSFFEQNRNSQSLTMNYSLYQI